MKLLIPGFFDRILGFVAALGAILYGLVVLLVCAMVAGRYFFNYPLGWVIEISEYVLLWSCFLGAAWVLKHDGHVRMDLVTARLSPKNQAVINILTSIAGVVICGVLTWYSMRSTWNRYVEGAWFDTVLRLPRAPVYAVVPVGFFLLTIEYLRITYRCTRAGKAFKRNDTRGDET